MKKFLNLFVLASLFLFAVMQVEASIEPQPPHESFMSVPLPDIPVMSESATLDNEGVDVLAVGIYSEDHDIDIAVEKCFAISLRPIKVSMRTRDFTEYPLPKSIYAPGIPLTQYTTPPLS